MPLHPEARALLDQLEALGDPPIETSTPEAVRALRASRIQPPTVALAEVRDVDADGIATRLYRPSMDAPLGLMAYFHGGGWVLGSIETHDHVARALAAGSGCAVLSVDYRLAPEHPFPAGLDDAFTVSTWVQEHALLARMRPGTARNRRRLRGREPRGSRHTERAVPVPVPAPRLPGHRRAGRDDLVRGARRGVRAHERRHALVPRALPLGRQRARRTTRGSRRCSRTTRHSRHHLEHWSSPPSSIRCATRARHTPSGSARWASRPRRPGTTG